MRLHPLYYVTFFFIQLFCLKGLAQNLKSYDKIEIQTLYINSKDSLVRFQVLSDSKKEKYLPQFTYWWYKSNAILKTTGGADGKLLNGDYVCFYPDNNLKEKGFFFKGVKDKLWITWYSNGKMQEQFNWKKGVLHGPHLTYSSDGNAIVTEKYAKGVIKKQKEKFAKVILKKNTRKTQPAKKIETGKESRLSAPKKVVPDNKKDVSTAKPEPGKKSLKQATASDKKKN